MFFPIQFGQQNLNPITLIPSGTIRSKNVFLADSAWIQSEIFVGQLEVFAHTVNTCLSSFCFLIDCIYRTEGR